MVALALLLPLDHTLPLGHILSLDHTLPLDHTLQLADTSGTLRSLCLQHCARILETSEVHWEAHPAHRESLADIFPLTFTASVALTHASASQYARDLCGRTILLLSRYMHIFPLVRSLLHALKAVAEGLRLSLSSETSDILKEIDLSTLELSNVPVRLKLPFSSEVLESMSQGGPEARGTGIEIGDLLRRCSNLRDR